MSAEPLFQALAAYAPDTPVLLAGEQSWRAAEMLAAIDALGASLVGCHRLAVLADNGPAWVMADLTALRESLPHIPLPGFFSDAQLVHALTRTSCDALLTDQPERIAGLGLGFAGVVSWCGLQLMTRQVVATPALPAGSAKVSFTSGSTGQPKGVCLSRAGLLDTAAAVVARLDGIAIERHLVCLPLGLLLENVAGIYAALLRGAQIHLPSLASLGWQGMAGFDPGSLHAQVERLRPNSLILVPELLKAWSLYLALSGQRGPDSLRVVAVGGARVDSAALSSAWAQGLPVCQGYGLTECASVVSLNLPGERLDDASDVGVPLTHVRVASVAGEIQIKSPAFLGYLDDTGHACGVDVTSGAFRTGDLGQMSDDAHLHLSGRAKHLLITSYGRNISPEWVEASLLAHPAVRQALVCGEARPWLAAILVPMPGADHAALASAVAAANRALPDYARLGDWLVAEPFSPLNGQLTGNGRPVRARILDHYSAPLAALYHAKECTDVVL